MTLSIPLAFEHTSFKNRVKKQKIKHMQKKKTTDTHIPKKGKKHKIFKKKKFRMTSLQVDVPESITMADLTGSCRPSISFSM